MVVKNEQTQAADIIIDPDTSPVQLMLVRAPAGRSSRRSWRHTTQKRKLDPAPQAELETAHIWSSWHLGDGHSRLLGTGTMPPMCEEGPCDTRWAGRIILPPKLNEFTYNASFSVYPRVIFQQGGYIYVAGGDQLRKVDPINGTSTSPVSDLIGTGTSADAIDHARFDTNEYISVGFSAAPWKIDTSGTITQSADGGGHDHTLPGTPTDSRWRHILSGRGLLYVQHKDNTIRSIASGADPFNFANYSGPITTGDGEPINSLALLGRVLEIGRPDGLNALDQDLQLVNQIPDIQDYYDLDNCIGMKMWHGSLLLPHARGLFIFSEDITIPIGPERIKDNESNLRGPVRSIQRDGEWFWAAVYSYTDSKIHLMAARERGGGEEGVPDPLLWFEVQQFTGDCFAMAIYNNRLWIAGSLDKLYFIDLSADGGPPDVNASYASTGYKQLPAVDGGEPLEDKYFKSVEVDAKDLSTTETVTIKYRTDRAINTWLTLTPTISSTTMGAALGRMELEFPEGTVAKWLQLEVDLTSGNVTLTPTVRRISLNYAVRQEILSITEVDVRIGSEVRNRLDLLIPHSPTVLTDTLKGYLDGSQHIILDPVGRRSTVLFIGPYQESESQDYDGKWPEMQATVRWMEVSG